MEVEWVQARARCSLMSVFRELEAQAEKDVRARQAIKTAASHSFTFMAGRQSDEFVIWQGDSGPMVMFRLLNDCISVQNRQREEIFRATVALNDHGKCMFVVNGVEMERWQVLRKALEGLFFA
jgi:hypothetical protein